jgi:hypothetical protein
MELTVLLQIMLLLIPSPDEQQRQLAEKNSHGYSSGEHIAT